MSKGEKSNRDFLKRAYAELIACRATVSVIFNKAKSYTPKFLGAVGLNGAESRKSESREPVWKWSVSLEKMEIWRRGADLSGQLLSTC